MCECQELKRTRLNVLMSVNDATISMFEKDINTKYMLEKEVEELRYQIETIKEETMRIVQEEKTSIGQPKFTSDEKRRLALSQYLKNDNRYTPLRLQISKKLDELEQCKARLEVDKLHIKQNEYNLKIMEILQ